MSPTEKSARHFFPLVGGDIDLTGAFDLFNHSPAHIILDHTGAHDPEKPEIPLIVAGPDLAGATGSQRDPIEACESVTELGCEPPREVC